MRLPMIAAAIALTVAPAARATEEPAHTVLEKEGRFELRAYQPMILAVVEVDASRRNAANEGFRPLADYIFGSNRTEEKIEMTAPVMQSRSTRIDMTAPVLQSPAKDAAGGTRWAVSFVMPAKWTKETLPAPANPDVQIVTRPARVMAVVRFSGAAGVDAQERRQTELESWISARGWRVLGPAETGFYDPPWTLPAFRRNEILIPVATD